MEFKIRKSEFLAGLSLAHGIADRKASLPILANVLLRIEPGPTLVCSATDLVVAVSTELTADIRGEGGVTLGARNLFEIVRSLPSEDITCTRVENQWVQLRSGKAEYRLVGLVDRDFPKLPSHKEIRFAKAPAKVLRELIAKTVFSVSTDETRYHLNGVLFESRGAMLRSVSTDGHRLSKAEFTFGEDVAVFEQSVIIPRKGVNEMARVIESAQDCEIGVNRTHAFVRAGQTVLSVKLVDAQFPPYEKVIPTNLRRIITCERALLTESLKRISLLASEKTSGVRIKLEKGLIEIASDNPDLGQAREEVEVNYEDDSLTVSFNSRYLLEALAQLGGDQATVCFGGELDPCVVRSSSDEIATAVSFLGVIMPMRT